MESTLFFLAIVSFIATNLDDSFCFNDIFRTS